MGNFAPLAEDAGAAEALKALHCSEQIFGLLVQNTAEYAIYTLDLDGLVTSWNSGAELITGYSRGEILGRHFGIFFTAEDREAGKPAQVLVEARLNEEYLDEGLRVRKDGTRFWARVVLHSLTDAHGQPSGFAKITRDETSKRADEADKEARSAAFDDLATAKIELEAAYGRLKLATDDGGIGIWDWNVECNVMLWDDWMYRLYGANRQDIRTG